MASSSSIDGNRLDSWKAIAQYLGKDVRTAIRWERSKGLPVHRVRGGERRSVFAYTDEIDDWLRHDSGSSDEDFNVAELASTPQPPALDGIADSANLAIRFSSDSSAPRHFFSQVYLAWLLGLGFLIATTFAVIWETAGTKIEISGEKQLTGDHFRKGGLVTNGVWLYFGEFQNGRITIAGMPVQGGPIRRFPTPFAQGEPEDISHDGKQLLVLAWESEPQEERALWILPLDGSVPRRVGTVVCHSASWSPDGHQIAFAAGNTIYLTSIDGSAPLPLHTFDNLPGLLRWSLDGKRLRFEIQDVRNLRGSFWQLTFNQHSDAQSAALTQLTSPLSEQPSFSNLLSNRDDAFVGHSNNGTAAISYLNRSGIGGETKLERVELSKRIGWVGQMAADPLSHRLFVVASQGAYSEMVWFDPLTSQFRPFLPGIFAEYVDFSRDGKSVAYVTADERELWVSKIDGRDAHLIATPAHVDLELPRWSPDGRFIAYTAKLPNRPYRVFVVSVADGNIEEAGMGTDDQGAPTWSPDGKWLVYGNVLCQPTHSCAIHQIELATKRQSVIPGSEDLTTARWSPNGRFIAALQPERRQVYLFDCEARKWRQIANGVSDNDLAWSADSGAVFASNPHGEKPAILRISLKGSSIVPAIDLSDLTRLPGDVSTFFAMAPNNSVILLRKIRGDEIYELDYRE
jgi:Tol biopolymer transport system component